MLEAQTAVRQQLTVLSDLFPGFALNPNILSKYPISPTFSFVILTSRVLDEMSTFFFVKISSSRDLFKNEIFWWYFENKLPHYSYIPGNFSKIVGSQNDWNHKKVPWNIGVVG